MNDGSPEIVVLYKEQKCSLLILYLLQLFHTKQKNLLLFVVYFKSVVLHIYVFLMLLHCLGALLVDDSFIILYEHRTKPQNLSQIGVLLKTTASGKG